jgi:N-acetylneuraminic acid mutarotase
LRIAIIYFAIFFLITALASITSCIEFSESKIENSWISRASMPDGLGNAKAVEANGKIYLMNGSSNFEYDPAINVWIQRAPMPSRQKSLSAEIGFGMVSLNGKIYVIGGGGTDMQSGEPFYFSTNEVYDPLTDTWQNKAPMPTARTRVEAACVNDRIYIIGVVNNNGGYRFSAINITEIYDPATDSWSSGKPAPFNTNYAPCAVVDNKIFIINGNINMIYETQNDTWSIGASPPSVFGNLAAGATTGTIAPKRIYILTGQLTSDTKVSASDYKITSTMNVFDPELNTWSNISVPISRSENAMAVVNDTIYIIGGAASWHPYELYSDWKAVTLTNQMDQYFPLGYGTIKPIILVTSPTSQTYNNSAVPLTFTVDKETAWVTYSLDRQDNVSIISNATLDKLANGNHNITVFAKYIEGTVGASETVSFNIAKSESFPYIEIIGISAVITALTGIAIYHFKKGFKKLLAKTLL